jgi:hypothetical protein
MNSNDVESLEVETARIAVGFVESVYDGESKDNCRIDPEATKAANAYLVAFFQKRTNALKK